MPHWRLTGGLAPVMAPSPRVRGSFWSFVGGCFLRTKWRCECRLKETFNCATQSLQNIGSIQQEWRMIARPPIRWPFVILTADALAATVAFYLAAWIVQRLPGPQPEAIQAQYAYLLVAAPAWVAWLMVAGGYGAQTFGSPLRTVRSILMAALVTGAVLGCIALYADVMFPNRRWLIVFFSCLCALGTGERWFLWMLLLRHEVRRVVVVGAGEKASQLAGVFLREDGYEVVGFLRAETEDVCVPETKVLGECSEFLRVLTKHAPIDDVLVAVPPEELGAWENILRVSEACELAVRIPPEFLGVNTARAAVERMGDMTILTVSPSLISRMITKQPIGRRPNRRH